MNTNIKRAALLVVGAFGILFTYAAVYTTVLMLVGLPAQLSTPGMVAMLLTPGGALGFAVVMGLFFLLPGLVVWNWFITWDLIGLATRTNKERRARALKLIRETIHDQLYDDLDDQTLTYQELIDDLQVHPIFKKPSRSSVRRERQALHA